MVWPPNIGILDGKTEDGEFWEILSIDENTGRMFDVSSGTLDADDDLTFTSMGNFTTEEAKDYFDSVHFAISDEEWGQMGWRNLRSAKEKIAATAASNLKGMGLEAEARLRTRALELFGKRVSGVRCCRAN